ncbi:MAG: hypothetical protein ACOX7N_08150 [Lawsonibacter sp.]|jgi:hypothetical protein
MDDSALLSLLKLDLERTGELPGDGEYLPSLIETAKSSLLRQGIQDDGSQDYGQTVVGTAAWIYRKRKNGEAEPAYLRRLRLDLLLARGREVSP